MNDAHGWRFFAHNNFRTHVIIYSKIIKPRPNAELGAGQRRIHIYPNIIIVTQKCNNCIINKIYLVYYAHNFTYV